MKIGIVTVPDSANYGSFLQGIALKWVLESMGHEVCFIATREKEYVRKIYYNWHPVKRDLKHPVRFIRNNLTGVRKYEMYKKDHQLIDIRDLKDAQDRDLFILGSDEIWNAHTEVFRRPVFYGAGMSPKIAYAVSTGNASEQDFEEHPEIKKWIQSVDDICVRDESSREIVEKITEKTPMLVCDPTMLVASERFMKLCDEPYLLEHRYILVYLYPNTISRQAVRELKKFAKKKGLKLVAAGFHHAWCDHEVMCCPTEFSSVVHGAEYVITATFHGSIFSILNEKQFISIRTNKKVPDLLNRLGLSMQLMEKTELTEERLNEKLCGEKICYESVNEKIQDWRESSRMKLKEVISGYAD